MATIRGLVTLLKVTILTLVVVLAFFYSSLGWRPFYTQESARVVVGAAILVAMYVLMVFELINKTLAALIGAAVSVAAHDCLIGYVSLEQILQWEDLETLSLLFGMMIIVSVLGTTGLFDYLAVWAYKNARGHFWALIALLGLLTGALSAVLDNVSTILLISPTLIRLSELEHVDARYLLMIMVVISNIGGTATPVGDPPNLIIINDELASSRFLNIGFGSFTAYASPCVLVTIATLLIYLKLVYKSKGSFRMRDAHETHPGELRASDNSTRSDSLVLTVGSNGCPAAGMRTKEDRYGGEVAARGRRDSQRLTDAELEQLLAKHSIKSRAMLLQSLGVLVIVVALFFAQSLPGMERLSLGWVSLFGALALLVMSSSVRLAAGGAEQQTGNSGCLAGGSGQRSSSGGDKGETGVQHNKEDAEEHEEEDNFERALRGIEWSTLIFFFGLFIVMEVMSKLGLIRFVGLKITGLIDLLPAGRARAIGAISIVLWSSAAASAFIDNVPFTSMMIKVLGTMMRHEETRMPPAAAALAIRPLVFALAFGACYGGNGTLIGASANVVSAGIAQRHGYPLSFMGFFKFAAPITLVSLVIANVYLVLVFVVLGL